MRRFLITTAIANVVVIPWLLYTVIQNPEVIQSATWWDIGTWTILDIIFQM